jgi:hypothetical protein
LSIDQFLKNFVIDEFTSKAIHTEGFVLLTEVGTTSQGKKLYDYAKIKTWLYYMCHKVRQDRI